MREIEEAQARTMLAVSCMVGLLAGVVSITLGVNGNRSTALLALAVAIGGAVAAGLAYRRYSALRKERWQGELQQSEQQLDELFNQSTSASTGEADRHGQNNRGSQEGTDLAQP